MNRCHNRIVTGCDGVVVLQNYHERKKTAILDEIRRGIAQLEKI